MKITKADRDKLLNSFLPMLDPKKTKKEKYRQLRTGTALLADGIKQVGIEKVKADKTYNAQMEREVVPDHKSNIIIMIEKARGQSDLEDKMASYLVQWGLPQFYRRPEQSK